MPILPPEPMVYPPDLFDTFDENGERMWWVLHVKPRQEKSLVRQLRNSGIACYLPQTRNRVVAARRVQYSSVPLFPGYVFLYGNEDDRIFGLTTGRVVKCLEVHDQRRLFNDLDQVQRILTTGLPVRAEKLQTGDEVEIRSGPLMGLRGTIIRAASACRFVVRVDFIQRGASVVLEDANIAPMVERSSIIA